MGRVRWFAACAVRWLLHGVCWLLLKVGNYTGQLMCLKRPLSMLACLLRGWFLGLNMGCVCSLSLLALVMPLARTQVVLVGVLMLRPQIVSKPAALLHDAIKAIVDQGRAQAEVAKSNRGVWRPA